MGNKKSKLRRQLPEIDTGTTTPTRQLPKIRFRVLIIGRANAGKTSILQRVCDTTDSPVVQRRRGIDREEIQLDPTMDRGEHSVDDELLFSNHDGYVFHDSRGFESGSTDELEIVQNFIREKSGRRQLKNRLHAIWYCVPMDNQRPELDLKFFKDICPDRNVPVIAVFTKHDQFLRNVEMYVADYGKPDDNVSDVAARQFEEHYLRHLGEGARFVRLEKMHRKEMNCRALLEETSEALKDDVVALMLLGVQKSNLELSISVAVRRVHRIELDNQNTRDVVRTCLIAFPQIWAGDDYLYLDRLFDFDRFHDDLQQQLRLEHEDIISHIMSLSIIAGHTPTGNSIYYLRLAIILIFKHAAALHHSSIFAKLALTQAESEFQNEHIMSKIEEHFTSSYQEYTIQQFTGFLINTNIEPSEQLE